MRTFELISLSTEQLEEVIQRLFQSSLSCSKFAPFFLDFVMLALSQDF